MPDDEPERSLHRPRLGPASWSRSRTGLPEGRRGWLIEEINGKPAIEDTASHFLIEAGFASTAIWASSCACRGVRCDSKGRSG